MQRLFTMFPTGAPALSLLLLRIAAATNLWRPEIIGRSPSVSLLTVTGLFGLSLATVSGLLTPLAAAACVLIEVLRMLDESPTLMPVDMIDGVGRVLVGMTLVLLGPGSFSVDARLFGRKVL